MCCHERQRVERLTHVRSGQDGLKMDTGDTQARKGRRSVALAAAVLVVGTLAGCSSHSGGGVAPSPVSLKATDPHLPAGWARFSYGSLSVGAPAGWKVNSTPLFCGSPPKTVSEYKLTSVTATSCPSFGPASPTAEAVAIECLLGKANGLYSGLTPTTTVDGEVLHREGTFVYLQGSGWEGVVLLPMNFGPPALGSTILATVEPTGKPC